MEQLPRVGLAKRLFVLLFLKARYQPLLRPLWKKQAGLPHTGKYCIKVRSGDSLPEAQALLFVSQNTSIPIPKLYGAFAHKGRTYIVMQHMEGHMAAHGLVFRSEKSKTRITDQLRRMINELRSVPPPPGTVVDNVAGGSFWDCRLPRSEH